MAGFRWASTIGLTIFFLRDCNPFAKNRGGGEVPYMIKFSLFRTAFSFSPQASSEEPMKPCSGHFCQRLEEDQAYFLLSQSEGKINITPFGGPVACGPKAPSIRYWRPVCADWPEESGNLPPCQAAVRSRRRPAADGATVVESFRRLLFQEAESWRRRFVQAGGGGKFWLEVLWAGV